MITRFRELIDLLPNPWDFWLDPDTVFHYRIILRELRVLMRCVEDEDAVSKVDTINPRDCRDRVLRFSKENMAKSYVARYRDIVENNMEW